MLILTQTRKKHSCQIFTNISAGFFRTAAAAAATTTATSTTSTTTTTTTTTTTKKLYLTILFYNSIPVILRVSFFGNIPQKVLSTL